MKPAHFVILVVVTLAALIGGTVSALHLNFGFVTTYGAKAPIQTPRATTS